MNKPLSRRGFLRAAAVAPVAAKSGALQALTAEIKGGLALAQAGLAVGADMPVEWGLGLFTRPKIYTAWKLGMLPEWVRAQVEEQITSNSGNRLSPDVASLRSVSLSAKFRINKDRTLARMWEQVDDFHTRSVAARAFWDSEAPNQPRQPL